VRIVASVEPAPRAAATAAPAARQVAARRPEPAAKPAPRRVAARAPEPSLLASVDADGSVQVNLKALRAARTGRPLRVRVEGHGTTSAASVEIRVSPQLQAMVAQVAAAATAPEAPCPRTRPSRLTKKFDAIVRSAAAAGGGNDLAVRLLDELNAGLSRSDVETGGA
jgi:hypothetical protein